jgi:hypothetical protein
MEHMRHVISPTPPATYKDLCLCHTAQNASNLNHTSELFHISNNGTSTPPPNSPPKRRLCNNPSTPPTKRPDTSPGSRTTYHGPRPARYVASRPHPPAAIPSLANQHTFCPTQGRDLGRPRPPEPIVTRSRGIYEKLFLEHDLGRRQGVVTMWQWGFGHGALQPPRAPRHGFRAPLA